MSTPHTPGRLHVGGDGTIVYSEDGWAVCNATVFHGRHGGPEVAREHARRLAACWNACEGIPTDELEPGEYEAYIISTGMETGRLEAERDALLEALRRLSFAAAARDNTMGDPCRLVEAKAELAAADRHAMAVIAKVTAQ